MAIVMSYTTTTPSHDVLRRHLKRALPVKLTRDEQTDIAIATSKKRLNVKQLEQDLDAEKKRRQGQINEMQREIDTSDRELATGEQERIVECNEVFRDGMVFVVRTDTWEEFESRPATAQEAQRSLPAVEATPQSGLVVHAALPVDDEPRTTEDEAPDDPDDDDDEPDDGLSEPTLAQAAAAESKAARAARRKAGGKSRGK